jgi:hypothetical protein
METKTKPEESQELPRIPKPSVPAFIEVEVPELGSDVDAISEPEEESESNSMESDIEPQNGLLTWKHNRMMLDIVVNEGDSEKYLTKSSRILNAPRTLAPSPSTVYRKRPDRKKVLDIIDKFIESEPEISIKNRIPDGKQEDISRRSISDEGELVSETLAQIYLKQGNKNKAVKIYEILKLKFPEKSAYFESLLQKIG